jgi:leucyl/phenylalanyl-tRNA---protein transferase
MTRGHTAYNKLYWVKDNIIASDFPDISAALREPDGLLAIGGDLSPERLLNAYRLGIFPWYSEGQPILWWSPDPRWVLEPEDMRISRSLQKTLRRMKYRVTFNEDFPGVIEMCAEPRKDSCDTWITTEVKKSYKILHQQGYAHSVECWHDNTLAGGLYGVAIGRIFFGESMFSQMQDASKVALVHLARRLRCWKFRLIDCQVFSKHLESLGAIPMPRNVFADLLRQFCTREIKFNWRQRQELM